MSNLPLAEGLAVIARVGQEIELHTAQCLLMDCLKIVDCRARWTIAALVEDGKLDFDCGWLKVVEPAQGSTIQGLARMFLVDIVSRWTYAKSGGCAFCSNSDAGHQRYIPVDGHKPGCPLKTIAAALETQDYSEVPGALAVYRQGRQTFQSVV